MRLIAHGCGPTVYPVNTIFSAREALKNGADMVELDLQLTSDKKLAVFHDVDLFKKYGVEKKCSEVTAQEFLSLRLLKDPAVPTHLLEDFFRCDISPILLHFNYKVLEETLDLVEKWNYQDKVLFGITTVEALVAIKKRFPDSKVLGFIHGPENIEEFAENGADFIRLWERWLNEENVARVKAAGVELWIMTGGPQTDYKVGVPDEASLARMMKFEPDGLLINNVPFVRSVLENL